MKNKNHYKLLNTLFDKLWPLNRSLTGNGVRKTHKIISNFIPIKKFEYRSGLKFNDWIIPNEWNIKDGYIVTPEKKKICEFKKNNLHVVGYSEPVNKIISKEDLCNKLHYDKKNKSAIPYNTSYYKKDWGFNISYNEYKKLKPGKYKVLIKSSLKKGSLTISELLIKGKVKEEILIHTYTCHPSLANNELSGPLLSVILAKFLLKKKNYFSYRFIFAPETIGANIILKKYSDHFKKYLVAGIVATCVGKKGGYFFKKSKIENSIINIAFNNIKKKEKKLKFKILKFKPSGSDERQYCSQGYNFPVGSIMTSPYGNYKEYHTSLDNKKIMDFKNMIKVKNIYLKVFYELEQLYFKNNLKLRINKEIKKNKKKFPKMKILNGEPQLSRHRVHYKRKDHKFADNLTKAIKWVVHYADGNNSIKSISALSRINYKMTLKACKILKKAQLLEFKK